MCETNGHQTQCLRSIVTEKFANSLEKSSHMSIIHCRISSDFNSTSFVLLFMLLFKHKKHKTTSAETYFYLASSLWQIVPLGWPLSLVKDGCFELKHYVFKSIVTQNIGTNPISCSLQSKEGVELKNKQLISVTIETKPWAAILHCFLI